MIAAKMSSLFAGWIPIMLSSRSGVSVMIKCHALRVVLGADGCLFILFIAQAMEWH